MKGDRAELTNYGIRDNYNFENSNDFSPENNNQKNIVRDQKPIDKTG